MLTQIMAKAAELREFSRVYVPYFIVTVAVSLFYFVVQTLTMAQGVTLAGSQDPGQVGAEVSVEDGYLAARQTGINCLAGIKQAIGDLDKVVGLVRTLNFVVCAPEFTAPNEVSSGLTDLFAEVFGADCGIGCRATIGVTSLANNHCFETWMDLEVK